jgi:hypothetical protein
VYVDHDDVVTNSKICVQVVGHELANPYINMTTWPLEAHGSSNSFRSYHPATQGSSHGAPIQLSKLMAADGDGLLDCNESIKLAHEAAGEDDIDGRHRPMRETFRPCSTGPEF